MLFRMLPRQPLLRALAEPSGSTAARETALIGRSILLVEDEMIVALDLQIALENAGAKVLGPMVRIADAHAAVQDGTNPVQGAILDVTLNGDDVFPVADTLFERGIPFVLHTGQDDAAALTERFHGMPICAKPCLSRTVLQALGALLT